MTAAAGRSGSSPAGASHALIEQLLSLSTTRRTVLFTSGLTLTATDEAAIADLPEPAWTHAASHATPASGS